jgi:uncharacterized protein YdeI (YjbR/CyaY-like superfamily)
MNPKVDFYFSKANTWREELMLLRTFILDSGLTEELKWGVPCYTLDKKNIVLIHSFKEYCAVLFFKGALLNDPKGFLIQQTENVQAARQLRFTNVKEIEKSRTILKNFIRQAIEVEKAGLKVALKTNKELIFPDEFKKILNEMPRVKSAFEALTPGRQRAYNLYFTAPKQSKTRESRIEKAISQILAGKGLTD